MRLILSNGYPHPYPADADHEQLASAATSHQLDITGVKSLEWKHELTVEFDSWESFDKAKALTGWPTYHDLILSAPYSAEDGYGHPAIVVRDRAYCGFFLRES